MITQTFNLNMIPESAPVVIKCDQYDIGTDRLVATLYNGSVTYTPSAGATAMIQGTKPDGLGFAYEATISGSTVTCDLTEQMTAVAGRTRVNLVITESENRTGTFVFWLDVQATGLADDVDISETVLPTYISAAQTAALNAEAWAVGERGDVPVSSSDETYENNAKYYANEASSSASNAYTSELNAASSAESAAASLAPSTQVDFEIIGNDLYLTKTIAGVEQPSEDLGRVVGARVTVDSALSSTSENAVQNKVINSALGLKQPKILDTPITISGTQQTTVEGALMALANALNPSVHTYGAEWDGTSTTKWSRTDGAENFTDPVPAVNNGSGSSPFDNIAPWSEMTVVEDSAAGTLVKIPKFYYKWTRDGVSMKLQISMNQESGFVVSPAHRDRGDGKGERDVVYIGRYHCADSTYKSTTGVQPAASMTRANFRTNIHNLGSTIWQNDYATRVTIWLLYLVEFADWNSQAVIGYGCSPSGAIASMGGTDTMQYHTGTSAASRTTYGWTQYRHIEGLWDNVYDWCDGIYFSGTNVYGIMNPNNFSDSSNGTLVGTRPTSSEYISEWSNPTASGYDWCMYPSAVAGSESTYICDRCYYYSLSGGVLYVGGGYPRYQDYGLFFLGGDNSATTMLSGIGSRLMKLP